MTQCLYCSVGAQDDNSIDTQSNELAFSPPKKTPFYVPGNINVLFSRFFEIDYRFSQTVDLLCGGSLMTITHVLTALKCPAREVWLLPCFPSLELSLFSFFSMGLEEFL